MNGEFFVLGFRRRFIQGKGAKDVMCTGRYVGV